MRLATITADHRPRYASVNFDAGKKTARDASMIPQNFQDLPSRYKICEETEREGERVIGSQRRVRSFIFGTYAAQVLASIAKG